MINKYWIGLSCFSYVSYNSVKELIKYFKSPENIWEAKEKDIKRVLAGAPKTAEYLISQRSKVNLDQEVEKIRRLGIDTIAINDSKYPSILKQIYDPPFVLYIKGKYLKEDDLSLAIVGTRRYTNYGKIAVEKLTRELVSYGFTIISGLAYGIDTFAHEYAIENDGRTIAVLGTGLDYIYPRDNKKLAEKVIENGALISEFPLGTGPLKYNFPQRNRIISGLSLGVLVVEGRIKSGAMITAGYALCEGREVFCIPGPINSVKSEGPNNLIKEGAKLVLNAEDVIDELSVNVKVKEQKKKRLMLSETETKLVDFLCEEPKTVDQASEHLGLKLPETAMLLIDLEARGVIESAQGKYTCFTNYM